MAKDPAFLFYPNDWLGGTLGMTFEEKGAYMELLMMQFNRGHMTSHMVGQVVGQLWVKIQDKFTQDEKGLWYNERLEIEQKKRQTFTASRKNNLKGENQYTKKQKNNGHINGHMTSHMENENINENKSNGIGGLGEKESENFNQYPGKIEIGLFQLKPDEVKSAIEVNHLQTKQMPTDSDISNWFYIFKDINFTGKEFYENRTEIVKHFKNWVKSQKLQNGSGINTAGNRKLGTSEARTEALKNW